MASPIYVSFTFSGTTVAKLIKFFSGGRVSHVELVYYSTELGIWVALGSLAGGWILTPFNPKARSVVTVFRLPHYDVWSGLRKNSQWIGASYDFAGLLGMLPVMVYWKVFRHWVKNPLNNKHAWFCSEIVRNILTDAGVPLAFDMPEASTSPQALLDAMYKLEGSAVFEYPTRDEILSDATTNGFTVS